MCAVAAAKLCKEWAASSALKGPAAFVLTDGEPDALRLAVDNVRSCATTGAALLQSGRFSARQLFWDKEAAAAFIAASAAATAYGATSGATEAAKEAKVETAASASDDGLFVTAPEKRGDFDFVLGADLVYTRVPLEALISTAAALLNSSVRVLDAVCA